MKLTFTTDLTKEVHANLQANQLHHANWSPTLASGVVSLNLSERWYVEIYGERALVDTLDAINLHYLLDSLGFSADYKLSGEITAVGAIFAQSISDGNNKNGALGRLIYSPAKLAGFYVQIKVKAIESGFDAPYYFSPEHLEEHMLLLGYAKSVNDDWAINGQAGTGMQYINSGDGTTIYQWNLGTRFWTSQHFGLAVKYGCTNTGNFDPNQASGDYQYCSGNLNLIGSW